MGEERLTLIDDGRVVEVDARITANGVRLQPAAVASALGWELKPEGLCRGGLCIPVRDRQRLVDGDGIELGALAQLIERPLALDVDERVAYLGASAAERGSQLATLQAPDFTLPDLAGRTHSLSDYRGRKVLLVAYASW